MRKSLFLNNIKTIKHINYVNTYMVLYFPILSFEINIQSTLFDFLIKKISIFMSILFDKYGQL